MLNITQKLIILPQFTNNKTQDIKHEEIKKKVK
jgi:hypothetical protein